MMNKKKVIAGIVFALIGSFNSFAQKIDRKALVERHTVVNTTADTLASLSVGNGNFAFTVDVTGLQTFPVAYANGVPLGTQSVWGWHSYPNVNNYRFEETLRDYDQAGRKVSYAVQIKQPEHAKEAVNWFRQNPARLQLGNVGFEIKKKDGSVAQLSDIKNIHQELNMYKGEITSSFTVDDVPVKVVTVGLQNVDGIAVRVTSALVKHGRLSARLVLPYPTNEFKDVAVNYTNADKHTSQFTQPSKQSVLFSHQLDTTKYTVGFASSAQLNINKQQQHDYVITPTTAGDSFEFTCRFDSRSTSVDLPSFVKDSTTNAATWQQFWNSGGAIDFSGSTDPRAKELERRVVLSQYLTKIQCSNDYPPQETGLTYNSWYGKPHLEMHWWHAYHYALWGRIQLLEKSLDWYKKVFNNAKAIAQRQGYDGVRWQKMTDNEGRETPSSVGALLIWQQPHVISFAELCYRHYHNRQTLNKYKDIVFATADFMASFAHYDSASKRYMLGKGVIPAQERFKAEETFNPTYELVYWHWALRTAQTWRARLGMLPNKKWDDVIAHLSPLPVQGDKYLFTESATDSYTNPEFKTDHPAVFGALGMLPKTHMLNTSVMKNTFDWIWSNWSWKDTWGWDFPLTAMTATRLGLPDKAIDALLMPIQTNTYLPNGHNYQDGRLTLYLPGNGGLLTAIAMMCRGYDDEKRSMPGIPTDGKWKVRWEGLEKMP